MGFRDYGIPEVMGLLGFRCFGLGMGWGCHKKRDGLLARSQVILASTLGRANILVALLQLRADPDVFKLHNLFFGL